jgi:hypothetical protein
MDNRDLPKEQSFPGIDYTIFDMNRLQAVPIAWTSIHTPIYKSSVNMSFIGLKENLNAGEVIEFNGLQYKIVKRERSNKSGRIYRIKRTDGAQITGVDVTHSKVGTKVRITSRRSYEQQLSLIFDIPTCPA